MMRSKAFADKQILIVDKKQKDRNDRTWCFWEQDEGVFQSIVSKEWQQLYFYSDTVSKQLEIEPYKYKLIRGLDFYTYCINFLSQFSNVQWLTAPVDEIVNEQGVVLVKAGSNVFKSKYVFNSIIFEKPTLKTNEYWLLQHFKGWYIKTSSGTFNSNSATLMDFRCSQENGTTFFYVLPISDSEALLEYTLFSKDLLKQEQYDAALKDYIANTLSIHEYQVTEEEFGIIPMSNYSFPPVDGNIINIGTAGGQTKGSSGYTFRFIQKSVQRIVECLATAGKPEGFIKQDKRFQFYDSVLLNILQHQTLQGADIFSDLFKKNKADSVLKFLDNETSLAEELKIISSLPTLPFAKAALKQLF